MHVRIYLSELSHLMHNTTELDSLLSICMQLDYMEERAGGKTHNTVHCTMNANPYIYITFTIAYKNITVAEASYQYQMAYLTYHSP